MNSPRLLTACLSASKLWLGALIGMDALFILFAWLAYPASFPVLVGLMVAVSAVAACTCLAFETHKLRKSETALKAFMLEPDEENEYALCQRVPRTQRRAVRQLGSLLRTHLATISDGKVQLADYETYLESWVHEIKTPLALMTLILDNRASDIAPATHARLSHVHDRIYQDVEKVLYFARLRAVHKDYLFEPLELLEVCRAVVADNHSILDEAGFTLSFVGSTRGAGEVVSDRKGLTFILNQLISNSVKYAGHKEGGHGGDSGGEGRGASGDHTGQTPHLQFEVSRETGSDSVILRVTDNGSGVPPADLPFIFDKGFTGEGGSRPGQATGIGLYLAQRMAQDLTIELGAESTCGTGLTILLRFPHITR
jgi:signal transduction histidine kinase